MKFRRIALLATLAVLITAGVGFASFQSGIDHVVGDMQFYNNEPNSDYGTAIAEQPTMRLDGSAGVIDYGAGNSTATSVSAGFIAANRFGLGAADCYTLEGTTADDFELSICTTDPTADVIATLPIMSATAYAVVASTLVTNSAEIANSIWMESNNIVAEGSGADNFETRITFANVLQDVSWTHRDVTSGAAQYGDTTVSYSFGQVVADHLDTIVMIADRAYVLEGVNASWQVAEATGDFDIMIEKLVGVTACGSGTDMLSAAIDTSTNGGGGTANTTTAGALHATPANLAIAAGDTLCIHMVSGTPNEIKGLVLTLALAVD